MRDRFRADASADRIASSPAARRPDGSGFSFFRSSGSLGASIRGVGGARLFGSASLVVLGALALAGCAQSPRDGVLKEKIAQRKVIPDGQPIPPGGGRYQVGKPYQVGDKVYVPREEPSYDRSGLASWYGGEYHHGTLTANGEIYDRGTISAAHPTLPLPSYARVTNLQNGRSIMVRVNDRGPYAGDRIIDLSERTADMLGFKSKGVGPVRVQYVGPAGLAGSDQRVLAASLKAPGEGASPMQDRMMIASADRNPTGPNGSPPAMRQAPTMVARAPTAPTPAPTMVAQAEIPSRVANERRSAEANLPSPSFQASLAATSLFGGNPSMRSTALLPPVAPSARPSGPQPAAQPLPVRVAHTSAESIAAGLADEGEPLSILPPGTPAAMPVSAPVPQPSYEPTGSVPRTATLRWRPILGDSYADTTDARIAAAHAAFREVEVGPSFADLAHAEKAAKPRTFDLGRHADHKAVDRISKRMAALGTVVILPPIGGAKAGSKDGATILFVADAGVTDRAVAEAAKASGASARSVAD